MSNQKSPASIKTADDYVASQPLEHQATLEQLRVFIKETVPEAEEMISYQVICYKYIYSLVGIGATRQFCSFYTMSSSLAKAMKSELSGIKVSGTTLHFPPNEPLPFSLINRIIQIRMQENEAKAMLKKKKK